MARERVMEKLSDVTLALQQKQRGSPQHPTHLLHPPVAQLPPIAPSPSAGRKHSKLSRSQLASTGMELPRKKSGWRSRHASVAPLPLVVTPHQVSPITRHVAHDTGSLQHRLAVPSFASSTPLPLGSLDDSYGREMQAYMDTYSGEAGSLHSSTLTSLTSSTGSESPDIVGSSAFNRHCHNQVLQAAAPRTPSGPLNPPQEIEEGCLALGPDARLHYTTREVPSEQGGAGNKPARRKAKQNSRCPVQIVPVADEPSSEQPQDQSQAEGKNNRTTSSSVCTIL